MALLDFLKKKEEKAKSQKSEKSDKALVEKKAGKKEVKPEVKKAEVVQQKPAVAKGSGKQVSYEAIKEPHISEKASFLAEKDQYIFQVTPRYNKKEIKRAVEGIYGVNVVSVRIIKIPPKRRRLGRTEGFKKSSTKAIVKVKAGQKIEII